ncbi:hypothetical protein F1193_00035 [Blastochloris sulfoviridis]|uniref:Glycoside-hydrolase family GH114 TIM-barrel domain-containing protein n=2 Tax=Blastochloris sulfoviridis TaxID=50712 RepID=A0A5M6I5T5_9HYPH|nr:hypothetical protein F1193_00035 [Blastochloris sulfoviridis]
MRGCRTVSSMLTRRTILGGGAGVAMSSILAPRPAAARVALGGESPLRWVVFYGQTANEDVLAGYDIVILDPAFKGSLARIGKASASVCGYLSIGEIRTASPAFASLDRDALLEENPSWPGTRRVDIRHPSWSASLLDQQIPALLSAGFKGLMLDTLDTPPYLEETNPSRYKGMATAAVDIVQSIRKRWPDISIIANRGYAILPRLVDCIDAIIAESLLTTPNLAGTGFVLADGRSVELQMRLLEPARNRHPALPILTLDYWDLSDRDGICRIYGRERALGHHPYVATRLLDRVVPKPACEASL